MRLISYAASRHIALPALRSISFSYHIRDAPKDAQTADVDEFGIPTRPTWSVKSLLASYPSPAIDDEILDKLHRLSALKAPEKGSEEREVLRGEMEELVRLVGAVRVAKIKEEQGDGLIDGRIYPLPYTVDLGYKPEAKDAESLAEGTDEMPKGKELLRHSQTTNGTVYVLPDLSKR